MESGVTTEGNPVNNGADKGVLGGMCCELSDAVKHAVGDHLLTFRYCFVLLNVIGHYFNILQVGSGAVAHDQCGGIVLA